MKISKTYHIDLDDDELSIIFNLLGHSIRHDAIRPQGLDDTDVPVMRKMFNVLTQCKEAE